MALNSRLGWSGTGTGEVSVAPPGTAEPPDATSSLPYPWAGLGLSDADGVTIEREVEKEATEHWQQLAPARYIYKSHDLKVTSNFQETKAAVLSAYFGELTFAAHGQGQWRGEIQNLPSGDVRALCIDWTDRISEIEVYHHRLFIARADLHENEEAQLTRTQEAKVGHHLHRPGRLPRLQRPRRMAHRRPRRRPRHRARRRGRATGDGACCRRQFLTTVDKNGVEFR